jgi:SAM-dependent methyltransferase
MGLYARFVIPQLLSLEMRNRELVPYRQRITAAATGRVLEIGIGSELNLPFYGRGVREIVGVDPSPALVAMARARQSGLLFQFTVLEGVGEQFPLEDSGVDTVMTNWSLCSVADPLQVLRSRRHTMPGCRWPAELSEPPATSCSHSLDATKRKRAK